jgi:hypothetical protein
MRRRKRRSPRRPGPTITQFAKDPDINQPPTGIRNAVKRGLIRAVLYNGVLIIPPGEKARYLAVWGPAGMAAQPVSAAAAHQQHHVEDQGLPEPAA